MRSPVTPVLCTAAICLAILGFGPWIAFPLALAFLAEYGAAPKPPR